MYYRIKENSFRARLASKKLGTQRIAIVFGNTIYLHNSTKKEFLANERWLKHELCHIRQFSEHGFLPFLFKYLIKLYS